MQRFTEKRDERTDDELWLLEHPPVFTLGQAGREEHLLDPGRIPVIKVDRGGQVTYHGPGQLVAYLLLDLRRRGEGIKGLIREIEQALIDLLDEHGVESARREGAPGVYVAGRKIAALGLRVRHGRTFHGLSLNVDGDLSPFDQINPCGYPGLEVTRLADVGIPFDVAAAGEAVAAHLAARLGYTTASVIDELPK